MIQHSVRNLAAALGIASTLAAGTAQAAVCSATAGQSSFIGAASTDDVALGASDADQCVVSGVNPQAGPNGNPSGFVGAFDTGWSLLSKGAGSALIAGVNFTLGFAQLTPTTGTWSVTTDQEASFDLAFAMHASDHSGAFLFDNESSSAALAEAGTWKIEWLNNGGNVPGFSNLSFFVRDVQVPSVPETANYAMLLVGLAATGMLLWRRRRSS